MVFNKDLGLHYSDDHGANWTSSPVPSGTNEATIVEKLNGTLYRNDRPAPKPTAANSYRKVSTGNIGSWVSAFVNDTNFPDPASQASILRYNDPKPNRIMFMNSNNQTQRRWPKVRITYDKGGSWPIWRDIPQNGSGILGGYTSLVKILNDFNVPHRYLESARLKFLLNYSGVQKE